MKSGAVGLKRKKMKTPTINYVKETTWAFPVRKQKLPDGRWVVMPGEPVHRCRTNQAVRLTGIPSKTLHRLADCGLIRRAQLTPNIVFWWPAEINAVIERAAEDPAYFKRIRYAADLEDGDLQKK